MARPMKRGLSYFPMDTDLLGNRKIRRLLDKFGCEGMAVYLSALCEIYAVEGYFAPFNRNFCFDLAYTLHTDETLIKEILTFCVEIELFDNELLEKHKALSSESIQRRYLEVTKRLYRREMIESFTFEKSGVYLQNQGVSSEETPLSDAKTPLTDAGSCIYYQKEGVSSRENPTKERKGKEIKRKEIKGKEKKEKEIKEKEIKRKEKEKKLKEKKEKEKTYLDDYEIFKNIKENGTKNQQSAATDEDAKRQAELRRMQEAATAN